MRKVKTIVFGLVVLVIFVGILGSFQEDAVKRENNLFNLILDFS